MQGEQYPPNRLEHGLYDPLTPTLSQGERELDCGNLKRGGEALIENAMP